MITQSKQHDETSMRNLTLARKLIFASLVVALFFTLLSASHAANKPKLILQITVDQLRGGLVC